MTFSIHITATGLCIAYTLAGAVASFGTAWHRAYQGKATWVFYLAVSVGLACTAGAAL